MEWDAPESGDFSEHPWVSRHHGEVINKIVSSIGTTTIKQLLNYVKIRLGSELSVIKNLKVMVSHL